MTATKEIEARARKTYARFSKCAKAYSYTFSRTTVTKNGAPCMLFLGNHSSGKSSLINWLLGGAAVQDVGLAPTDDGFTMLVYGEVEEDICGPAAVARLPAEFAGLGNFGASFLQHLRVKVRNRPLLKSVVLVDSPGMIDTAEHTVNRTYDFEGVVRLLAELCDMVFFLLDPDKPGTTGESVNIFSKCLGGMDFKLNVLLNKCDAFTSLYDFARTYGTVCWNLARVLKTKDLPKIWTIYSGEERKPGETGIDLTDFNRKREDFLNIVKNDADARRRDNLFSQTQRDFLGLSIRMRIVNRLARTLVLRATISVVCGALLSAICYFGVGAILPKMYDIGPVFAHVLGALAAVLAVVATACAAKLVDSFTRVTFAERVDDLFEKECKRDVFIGRIAHLQQIWAGIRDDTAEIVRNAPLGDLPFFGEYRRRRLDVAREKIFAAVRS